MDRTCTVEENIVAAFCKTRDKRFPNMGARLQGEREREARVTQLGLGPPLPGTPAAQSAVPEQLVAPAPDLVPQGGATAQDNGEQVSLTQQEDTGDGEEDAVPWH